MHDVRANCSSTLDNLTKIGMQFRSAARDVKLRYRQTAVTDDLPVELLTQVAAKGGAFAWLNDPAEDGLYSDDDGEPV